MPRSVDTVLTINPDGTISADFTGHISALGIDIISATLDDAFSADRKIRWHDTTLAGAVTGFITSAYSATGLKRFVIEQLTFAIGEIGEVLLRAIGGGAVGSRIGELSFAQDGTAVSSNSRLRATWDTAGQTHTIVRGDADSGLMPIGSILPYAANTYQNIENAPPWHICDGTALSRTTYARLFAVIGTTWGAGDGSTTFNLPDLRGRTLIGAGAGAGLTARVIAAIGGEETHIIIPSEAPSHNHGGATTGMNTNQSHAHTYPFSIIGTAGATRAAPDSAGVSHTNTDPTNIDHTHSISTNGSDQPHNNMQPFIVIQYIIRTG